MATSNVVNAERLEIINGNIRIKWEQTYEQNICAAVVVGKNKETYQNSFLESSGRVDDTTAVCCACRIQQALLKWQF